MKATLTVTLPRQSPQARPWDHRIILVILVILLVKYDLPAALLA
ncbi:hypothetical protein [Microbispora triticiradicis]|nr:hypothetical protein [Microbispora fusca]